MTVGLTGRMTGLSTGVRADDDTARFIAETSKMSMLCGRPEQLKGIQQQRHLESQSLKASARGSAVAQPSERLLAALYLGS